MFSTSVVVVPFLDIEAQHTEPLAAHRDAEVPRAGGQLQKDQPWRKGGQPRRIPEAGAEQPLDRPDGDHRRAAGRRRMLLDGRWVRKKNGKHVFSAFWQAVQ